MKNKYLFLCSSILLFISMEAGNQPAAAVTIYDPLKPAEEITPIENEKTTTQSENDDEKEQIHELLVEEPATTTDRQEELPVESEGNKTQQAEKNERVQVITRSPEMVFNEREKSEPAKKSYTQDQVVTQDKDTQLFLTDIFLGETKQNVFQPVISNLTGGGEGKESKDYLTAISMLLSGSVFYGKRMDVRERYYVYDVFK